MKIKFRTILVCAALTAAVSLSVDYYFCSKDKCLRKSVCRVISAVSKSHSCCQAKVQASKPQNPHRGGPKRCCFKKPAPEAALYNHQLVFLTNQVQPVCFAGATLSQLDFISEPVNLSTGPPVQFADRTQAVLCIFII